MNSEDICFYLALSDQLGNRARHRIDQMNERFDPTRSSPDPALSAMITADILSDISAAITDAVKAQLP